MTRTPPSDESLGLSQHGQHYAAISAARMVRKLGVSEEARLRVEIERDDARAQLTAAERWIAAKCTIAGCWKSRTQEAEAQIEVLVEVLQGRAQQHRESCAIYAELEDGTPAFADCTCGLAKVAKMLADSSLRRFQGTG